MAEESHREKQAKIEIDPKITATLLLEVTHLPWCLDDSGDGQEHVVRVEQPNCHIGVACAGGRNALLRRGSLYD